MCQAEKNASKFYANYHKQMHRDPSHLGRSTTIIHKNGKAEVIKPGKERRRPARI